MNNDEWLKDNATRMGEVINLPDVTNVSPVAKDAKPAQYAPEPYDKGDVVDVTLKSQDALIAVQLEKVRRDCGEGGYTVYTFIGRLKKGEIEGVKHEALVSFRW